MDNASKGLITAGAVLVSILLITTGVYVMNTQKPEQYVADARDKMWSGVDTGVGLGEKSEENLGENVEKLATKKEDFPTTTLRARTLFAGTIPNASIESLVFIDSNTHKAKDGALITEDVGAVKKGEVMAYAYDNDGDNLYEVVVAQPGGVKANANSIGFLYGANNLEQANFKYLEISNIVNMDDMFQGCSKIANLDLTSFDTTNVITMSNIFNGCSNLKSVDVSSFNTKKVTTMFRMFAGCSSLVELDLYNFETPMLENIAHMFHGCSSLKSLNVTSFDTTKVTMFRTVFAGCSSLTSLDLSSFNAENVTDMGDCFMDCSSLKSLDLSGFKISNLINMGGTFKGCGNLEFLDISSFDTSNVTSMRNLFNGCKKLTTLNLGEKFVINTEKCDTAAYAAWVKTDIRLQLEARMITEE